MLKQVVELVL